MERDGNTDKEHMRRKLGFSEDDSISNYDTIMFSLYEGEHWSLLVCYLATVGDRCIYHYDSLFGTHTELARRVVQMLIYVNILPSYCKLQRLGNYTQQKMDFECGYAVVMMVGAIASLYADGFSIHGERFNRVPLQHFPRMDAQGLGKLYKDIFHNFLGGKTTGTYPSEHIPTDGSRPTSLVTLYGHVRDILLNRGKVTKKRTLLEYESNSRIAKKARTRHLFNSSPLA
jgi:hypothetical protein